MGISAPHNLRNPDAGIQRPYGVRITLKRAIHSASCWARTGTRRTGTARAAERDAALIEMARKHEYSRPGDKPALKFDKVEKLHESRGL